jgi:membrane associated rhomboid family serine protease
LSEGQVNNANYVGRPSICRNCGALVGATETSCSLCGAPKASSAAAAAAPQPQTSQQAYDHEAMRFARAILSRSYIFTIIFLISNVFVFLLMWSSSGLSSAALWEPQYPVLIAYGAKLNFLIKENHEWWRFVTPVFIHIGLAHLLVNMYGLWMIGPYVERLYGSAKFVVLWVITGIAGVAASYLSLRPGMAVGPVGRFLFRATDGPAAGASGALFGLIGLLFVFGIKFRHELPEGFKRAFGTGLLPVIMINLFIGYLGRGFIDNAAHLGGLFSGALFGLVIGYKRPGERAGVAVVWHVLQVAALALVVLSFGMVARHFRDSEAAIVQASTVEQPQDNEGLRFNSFLNAMSAGEAAFVKASRNGDKSGIDDAIEQVDHAPQIEEKTEALRNELKSLLIRMKEFDTSPKQGGGGRQRVLDKEGQALGSDFKAWQAKVVELIKTEGKKYGIELQEPDSSKTDSSNSK